MADDKLKWALAAAILIWWSGSNSAGPRSGLLGELRKTWMKLGSG